MTILPPNNFTFELNKNSQQAKGLRGWWPTAWSSKASQIYNLAYDRAGIGVLDTQNTWSVLPVIGASLEFAGAFTNSIVSAGSNASHRFSNEISYFAWIYVRGLPSSGTSSMISSVSDNITTSGWEFALRENGGTTVLGFAYNDGGVQGWYTGTATFAINTLYHVGFTYKAGTLNFYINGKLDSSPSITSGTITYSGDTTRLGYQPNNFPFNGAMGDMRLYNRFLIGSEVLHLYKPTTRWELYKSFYPDSNYIVPVSTQTIGINAASSSAVGLVLTTSVGNVDKSVNNAVASAVGYQVGFSVGAISIAVNAASSSGVGYNLTTNYIQVVGKSDASAVGNNLTFSPGAINASVNNAISSAVGYVLSNTYIQDMNNAVSSGVGYDVAYSVGGVTKSVNSADSSAVGYNLTITYTQTLGQAISSAIGYDLTAIPGAISQTINKADSSAIGYDVNPVTGTPTDVNSSSASAVGYNPSAIAGNVNISINKTDATGVGYTPQTNYGVNINKADSSAIGNNVNNTLLQAVNNAVASAIGYPLDSLLGSTPVSVNRAVASAIGNNVSFTTGSIIVTVNYAIATGIGYNPTIGTFVIILSPDRTYHVIADNRIYTVLSENRTIKAREN